MWVIMSEVYMLNAVLSILATTEEFGREEEEEDVRYGCSSETVSPRRARFWVVT